MSKSLDDILKDLPDKPPRSRLTQYAELIDELRRRGWTYRGIVGVLAEICGVEVSVSNLHHFVAQQAKAQRKSSRELPSPDASGKGGRPAPSSIHEERAPNNDSEFTFDPTVPLRIKGG